MTPVDFWCDLSQHGTELLHCWEDTVGSCHAPIALRADWQQQLRRCQSELGFRYVRFHGLLSDDVGTVVTHKDQLLYFLQRRSNCRLPPVDWHEAVRRTEFHAHGARVRIDDRLPVSRQRDAPEGLRRVVHLDPHARFALGRAIRYPGSGGVVFRSVERTESEGFLDWHPTGVFHAVSGHGGRHQEGRPVAESRRTGDGARWLD